MSEIKVGDYAMHHMHGGERGTLVRVESVEETTTRGRVCSIAYIQGAGNCGGYSGAWGIDEFRPITDPVERARAKIYEARRLSNEHERAAQVATDDIAKWCGVLDVLTEGAS